jgi:antitoxin PrlF
MPLRPASGRSSGSSAADLQGHPPSASRLDQHVRNSYHDGMKTTVSEKGQITIPKRLRDRLGLRPGTVLDFEEAGGRLVGRKLVPADQLDQLVGILPRPRGGTDAMIRELRGPGPDNTGS